jgi:Flagellar biosynthesis protein, FliO
MELLQQYMTIIYIVAALLVAALLLFVLMRVLGGSVRGRKGSRLGISEYYEIDKTRRLVIVRRDESEHLVLIGGNQDLVIETDIGAASDVVQPIRQAPRPAVFGNRRPNLRPVEAEDIENR